MEIKKMFVLALGLMLAIVFLKQSEPMEAFLNQEEQPPELFAFDSLVEPNHEPNQQPAIRGVQASKLSAADESALKQRIEAEAVSHRVAPINARLDRVWKAIPGYNGIEVDVEKSLEHMSKVGADKPLQLVFREVEPDIQLEDLGAHPIYKGNPDKKMVSLMINVAWGNEFIDPMLHVLEKENVKATFFFDGSWLNKNMDIAKQIQAAGHELSNHAYSHKDMSKLSRASAKEEIVKTEQLLKDGLGVENRLFAPPSGDFNQETVQIAHELGLKTVLWTIDTVDWRKPEPSAIIEKISTRLEPGAMILMHPTPSASQALEGMIKAIKRKGMQLGPVGELLSSKRLTVQSEQILPGVE
jgi:probable sporulation protein (polysaccharide deacetylase family)